MKINGLLLILVLPMLLVGCTTETIYLTDPKTGTVAKCGGHSLAFPIYATVASTHDHECVEDYKSQGYERVPAP